MRPTAMHVLTLLLVLSSLQTVRAQDLGGTHGDVIVDGDPSFNASGVVLRAKTSRPSVAAQLGSSGGTFVVFTAASAELLRVQADGNVGVGTSIPRSILHLARNNGSGIGPELILENNAATIGDASALTFSSNHASRAQIRSGIDPSSAAGILEFKTGLTSLQTRMTISGAGDVSLRGGAIPLQVHASTPVAVTVKDLNHYGLPHGLRMEMPGNSDIMVGRMQLGRWNAPVIQSLDGPLQLNADTRHEVQVPARLTIGDLNGDAGVLIVSGDNPGDPNAPALTLARKDGNDAPIAAFAFSIDEQGRQLKLLYGTTNDRPATPILTIDATGALNAPQLTFHGAIVGAVYQDIAEWVPSDADLEPGTVVVLSRDRTNAVTVTTSAYDSSVAGVVSAQPGILLGEGSHSKEMIATTGRVKVKVDATRHPIAIGDLLVSSDTPGRAMKSVPVEIAGAAFHRPGTIIGKALEPLDGGAGEILVLLSLQ